MVSVVIVAVHDLREIARKEEPIEIEPFSGVAFEEVALGCFFDCGVNHIGPVFFEPCLNVAIAFCTRGNLDYRFHRSAIHGLIPKFNDF